ANELGLTTGGPEFDEPVSALNNKQLALAHPCLAEHLDLLLAVLQRHGLIVPITSGVGAFLGGGGQRLQSWEATPFGRTTAERLEAIGSVLS
ncbi:MAG: hypothetical protein M3510_04640, partial [Actinomycetota bacterium]|nr:hypothetical protein [Actinomycetota bacterium]